MSITATALKIQSATQAGTFDAAEQLLQEFNALLTKDVPASELSVVQTILNDTRQAAYAQRSQIVRGLQQLELSSSYVGNSLAGRASWELSA